MLAALQAVGDLLEFSSMPGYRYHFEFYSGRVIMRVEKCKQ